MELSRIKVLYGGLILQLLFTIAVPLPYNKYGRQCSDIGCLSNQVCVMAYDSCSLAQREGSECGRYPTCKKNTEAGLAAGPSDSNTDLYSNQPGRAKPGSSAGMSDDDVLASLGLNPSNPTPNHRPSAPAQPANNGGGYNPYQSPYPTLPPRQPVQPAQPQYPGSNNNYYGGSGGTGGGNRGQFDGAGGHIVVPSPKPPTSSSSGGGGFFSGIFGGIQNAVSNAVKQQVGTYINQRLGIGPAAGQAGGTGGGLGGLLDARNFIDQKKFGGLFAEKPSGNSGSNAAPAASTSGGHPYPVTVDQRPIQSVVGGQQQSAREYGRQQQSSAGQGTPAPYGWKLD